VYVEDDDSPARGPLGRVLEASACVDSAEVGRGASAANGNEISGNSDVSGGIGNGAKGGTLGGSARRLLLLGAELPASALHGPRAEEEEEEDGCLVNRVKPLADAERGRYSLRRWGWASSRGV
jgi:hypothetical protein